MGITRDLADAAATGDFGGGGTGAFPTRETFIATQDQTSFSFQYSIIEGTPQVDVWLNGFKLQNVADFTATDEETIVLNTPAQLDDVVDVVSYIAGYVGTQREEYEFTAIQDQTSFAVTYSLSDDIDVYRLGHKLADEDFTATDQTNVVLVNPCNEGDDVNIVVFKETITSNTIGSPEMVSTLPVWSIEDEGRFIYTQDTDKTYMGTGVEWKEIQFITEEPAPVYPTDGLISEWTMDEYAGNNIIDPYSSYNMIMNSATLVVEGIVEHSLSFNGSSNAIVSSPDFIPSTVLNDGAFTLSFWIYPEDASTRRAIIESYDGSRRFYFEINTNGIGYGIGSTANISTGTLIPTLNIWSHILITYDLTNLVIYINESNVYTFALSPSQYSTSTLKIGGGAQGNFLGNVDQVRIYNRVLNSTEVSQLYNSGNGI